MAAECVKVVVRCRPMNERERELNCEAVVTMDSSRGQCFIRKPEAPEDTPKQFTFDGAYYTEHCTEQIYNEIAYPLVEGVTEGYNGTIFAYGQTGSGKSFSMQGISHPPAQRGIIPRAFEHIFESIQCAENTKFLVRASYLEIYNEEIRDLLGEDTKQKLELKEHPDRGVYVKGLSMHTVHRVADCERIMDTGWKNRSVGYTLMNKDSSRSHSIFTINIEICSTDEKGEDHLRAGKLNLVDLAGSERQSKTGATGERLKEATKINLSLSALGNVISALVDGKAKHIPYRDSKLTRMLQDSLGGNTKTLMVACLSPADNNYDETLSTLRYANRAKNIKNKPRINEDPKDALLREYQEEIKKLKVMLMEQSSGKDLPVFAALPVKPPEVQSNGPEMDAEAEKRKIRQEYEEKFAQLKAEYEAEQKSRVRLEEDISNLRNSYDLKLASMEEIRKHSAGEVNSVTVISSPTDIASAQHPESAISQVEVNLQSPVSEPAAVTLHPPEETPSAVSPQQVLARLQILEQQVVGGEQAKNKDLKEKQKHRKKYADERKRELVAALQSIDEDGSDRALVNVYESIQEELQVKNRLLEKKQKKLRAAEIEIEDLHAEFERDRNDYLVTIRRQERELLLYQQILGQIQSLIRRDCNYSNLDRIRREASWDEDSGYWKLPEVVMQRTSLPTAPGLPQAKTKKVSPVENGEHQMEEDRYKKMLSRSDSENIANNYFKSKRASQILSADPLKSFALHNASPAYSAPANTAGSVFNANISSVSPIQGMDMPLPRPFRLESLELPNPSAKSRRKKSKVPPGFEPL
ncbi:kinesin KIF17 isoform X2 [Pelobates cultripes]|uniref:Kinesin-like protein n=1 Tax=Pelobates cultripes TaxID=61616 RepID=A0AAD1T3H4_PELCU|nr:kinesin KIF17 isoform X2 [Pelobates cultripes]